MINLSLSLFLALFEFFAFFSFTSLVSASTSSNPITAEHSVKVEHTAKQKQETNLVEKAIDSNVSSSPITWNYDAKTLTLIISSNLIPKSKYVFHPAGAISEMYELEYAPSNNLIASSFAGEKSDRVIQWTAWNANYIAGENLVGDGERRANATMSGCWHDFELPTLLSCPTSTTSGPLVFVSKINSWFYPNLNCYGRPEFITTSTYEVLAEGSLKLTRAILRKPWIISKYFLQDPKGTEIFQGRPHIYKAGPDKMIFSFNGYRGVLTSYLEAWTPFKRTYLPDTETARGDELDQTDGGHYGTPDPTRLGGWVMAKNNKIGVAVVFGNGTSGKGDLKVVFNSIYNSAASPNDLNILLPGVEATWPDDYTLTQTLIFVPGELEDVKTRAAALKGSVPVPKVEAL